LATGAGVVGGGAVIGKGYAQCPPLVYLSWPASLILL
jgi:hypothetical protein